VNDEASALLMTRFYDELRRSPEKSKAHALRAAQMALLADGRYEHPAHWSAFMVIGNWL
jgi:CHAT domain-containing protein